MRFKDPEPFHLLPAPAEPNVCRTRSPSIPSRLQRSRIFVACEVSVICSGSVDPDLRGGPEMSNSA